MGQDLLNPPSVKGWDGGLSWINTGLLMERVNFAAQEIGDLNKPGVQEFVRAVGEGRGAQWGPVTPEEAVQQALLFMGPLQPAPDTLRALLEHVRRDGDLTFGTGAERQASAERLAELLQLVAASREYQFC
jgi:hypothetical protein